MSAAALLPSEAHETETIAVARGAVVRWWTPASPGGGERLREREGSPCSRAAEQRYPAQLVVGHLILSPSTQRYTQPLYSTSILNLYTQPLHSPTTLHCRLGSVPHSHDPSSRCRRRDNVIPLLSSAPFASASSLQAVSSHYPLLSPPRTATASTLQAGSCVAE